MRIAADREEHPPMMQLNPIIGIILWSSVLHSLVTDAAFWSSKEQKRVTDGDICVGGNCDTLMVRHALHAYAS